MLDILVKPLVGMDPFWMTACFVIGTRGGGGGYAVSKRERDVEEVIHKGQHGKRGEREVHVHRGIKLSFQVLKFKPFECKFIS